MFCTFSEVLQVQVPPSPRKQAAVLRALRVSSLLQQGVCASRLGDTQTIMREASSSARESTRSFRCGRRANEGFQSEQQRSFELVSECAWLD